MATPEGNSRRSWPDPGRGEERRGEERRGEERTGRWIGPRGRVDGARATVLGSLTIPGHPEQVSAARAFVARTLSAHRPGTDADTATLLTSEIVTNAIVHTKSGVEGGTVTIVVIGIPRGVLVEIIDSGCGLARRQGRSLRDRRTRVVPGPEPRRPVGISQGACRNHGLVPPGGGG